MGIVTKYVIDLSKTDINRDINQERLVFMSISVWNADDAKSSIYLFCIVESDGITWNTTIDFVVQQS